MTARILIADDDPVQRRLLEAHVARMGYDAVSVEGGEAALAALKGRPRSFAALILDLMMPETDGLAVLRAMRRGAMDVPAVVQTAVAGIDVVVEAMRAGAFDFIVKPASFDKLQSALGHAVRVAPVGRRATRQTRDLAGGPSALGQPASPAMRDVLRSAERAANSAIPVLIQGETGVGKEWLAEAIRAAGPRAKAPFVAINCGALPAELAESILFGHEQGAFTGATERRRGRFLEADAGTLFLDEVGELSPAVQAKLLRALQSGEVDAVGGKGPVRTDVRIISATNRDLGEDVKTGRFRSDLYYRLDVFPLRIPPLRERREEIHGLCDQFLERFSAAEGSRPARRFSPAARDLLAAYDWPGNIRQLENAVHRAVVLADAALIQPCDFPQISASVATDPTSSARDEPSDLPASRSAPLADPGAPLPIAVRQQAPSGHLPNLAAFDDSGHLRRLDEVEGDLIRAALTHSTEGFGEIARRLGIGRSTLYRKIKELRLV